MVSLISQVTQLTAPSFMSVKFSQYLLEEMSVLRTMQDPLDSTLNMIWKTCNLISSTTTSSISTDKFV